MTYFAKVLDLRYQYIAFPLPAHQPDSIRGYKYSRYSSAAASNRLVTRLPNEFTYHLLRYLIICDEYI
jgi:hypothetical protein